VEEVAVEAVEYLGNEFGVVLFAQEECQDWFEQFCVNMGVLSMRVQHSASWQIFEIRASI